MKYKFFAIPARNPDTVTEELNAFCSQHRISFIEKQLVLDGADSFWSVCVTWLDGEAAPSSGHGKKAAVDYKQVLSESDFDAYVQLRDLRKELSESQGVPPYALFTNEQLAEMVQQRVSTKAALQAIRGVGKSRVDKYGEPFLQKLAELWQRDVPDDGDETHAHRS